MKKIVLAIDSFKGAEEIHRILPSCQTVCIPIADGGEGMLDTLIEATQGTFVSTQAHDPLMRIRPARYGILGDQRTAIIEMAEINGLTTLSPIERNPMETSTYESDEDQHVWHRGTDKGRVRKRIPPVHYRHRRKCYKRCRHGHDTSTWSTSIR